MVKISLETATLSVNVRLVRGIYQHYSLEEFTIRQFQCVPITYVIEIKETYFEKIH